MTFSAEEKLTVAQIKERFYKQFHLGAQSAGVTFKPKEITVAKVRGALQSKTTSVQDKRLLNATGDEFWVTALRVMNKLRAAENGN